MRGLVFLVVTMVGSGCALLGFGTGGPAGADGGASDGGAAADAAQSADGGQTPDGAVASPDASVSPPDAAVNVPDAAVNVPDAAVNVPDAAVNVPDAAVNVADASVNVADAAVVTGSDGGWFGDPRCGTSGLTICESFEGAAVGGFPSGWSLRTSFHWGGISIGVSDQDAARGTKALRVEGGDNGANFMRYDGALGALATQHYGRILFKVETPAPFPSSGVLHGDIIQGEGPSPRTGAGSNVRWGVVENTQDRFQWLYNVQPYNSDPEFGDGTNYDYSWPGEWQCMEWFWSSTLQDGTLWIDEEEIPVDVGSNHAPELPVFENLAVGWANYQPAGAGFVVWIDEVAFHASRIGCSR